MGRKKIEERHARDARGGGVETLLRHVTRRGGGVSGAVWHARVAGSILWVGPGTPKILRRRREMFSSFARSLRLIWGFPSFLILTLSARINRVRNIDIRYVNGYIVYNKILIILFVFYPIYYCPIYCIPGPELFRLAYPGIVQALYCIYHLIS